jgi:hypothetical protein
MALAGAARVGVAGTVGEALAWGARKVQQAVHRPAPTVAPRGMSAEARHEAMPKTFKEFVARPMVLAALGNYAKRVEHSPENVPFLLAVHNLQEQLGQAASSSDIAAAEAIKRKLLEMHDKYVREGAPLQVNLPGPMRHKFDELADKLRAGTKPSSLGEIALRLEESGNEIWKLLSTDTMRRFEASELYTSALLRESSSHAAAARVSAS